MIETAIQKEEDAYYDNVEYGYYTQQMLSLDNERLLLRAKIDVLNFFDIGSKASKNEYREKSKLLSIRNAIK